MQGFARAILSLGLVLQLSACGGGSDESGTPEKPAAAPIQPSPTPAPAPAQPEPPAVPAPAPAQPEPPAAPAATGPGNAAAGAPLYATFCASCHGPKGNGDGPVSAGLNPKPAKHSDTAYMKTLSDEHVFKVIKEGGQAVGKSPMMTPWGGTLSDAQIRDLVAFVRSLAK